MSDAPEFSPGEVLLGKLAVVRRLGAGGIGAVYEVEHQLTKHRRALKVLHPKFQADRELVERFLREASAAGRIGNPHIIECFDAGRLESGAPYILMELLVGEPLSDRLRHQGQLGAGDAVDFMLQVSEGLGAAHLAGIVHRDLKPDNLFLITQGGRDFLKVLDFGISKFDTALTGANAVTATGTAMGTPLYMPPEQMRGAKDVDQRADVYALGVILYECLSGRVPYGGESFAELAAAVLSSVPIRLETLRPDLPAELCSAAHRAFAREPGDRYQSVEAFAEALRPFSGLERSIARTVSGERDFGSTLVKATPATPANDQPSTAPIALDSTHPSRPAVAPPAQLAARPSMLPRVGLGLLGVAIVVVVGTKVLSPDDTSQQRVVDAGVAMPVFLPDAALDPVDAGAPDAGAPDAGAPDAGTRKRPPVKRPPTGEIDSSDLEDKL